MIRSLLAALPVYLPLGKVKAKGLRCGHWHPLIRSTIEQRADVDGCTINLAGILTCDDPAEVGILCEIDEWCMECKREGRRQESGLPPSNEGHDSHPPCSVTHRIFLWTGEPVAWEKVLWNTVCECGWRGDETTVEVRECSDGSGIYAHCPECSSVELFPALTAVVLVGQQRHACSPTNPRPIGNPIMPEAETIDEAAQACAEAGVQFVIPGDQEKGRLELP